MTGSTPDSLRLSWTVAQGAFDSFMVQYKDAQGRAQAVPIRGHENEVTVPGLESDRKYKMNLYGLHGRQRVGPVSVVATTGESGLHGAPSLANPQPCEQDLTRDPSHFPPPSLSRLQFCQTFTVYFPTSQDFASSRQPLTKLSWPCFSISKNRPHFPHSEHWESPLHPRLSSPWMSSAPVFFPRGLCWPSSPGSGCGHF